MMDFGAPQTIVAVMMFATTTLWVCLHGMTIKINGYAKVIDALLLAIVLYWGGFWS